MKEVIEDLGGQDIVCIVYVLVDIPRQEWEWRGTEPGMQVFSCWNEGEVGA